MSVPIECPGCRSRLRIDVTGQAGTVTCSKCSRVIVLYAAERIVAFNQTLAEALVAKGVLTQVQVDKVLAAVEGQPGGAAADSFRHLLIEKKLVTPAQIGSALGTDGEVPPLQLPGYDIFGRIGGGGMGSVYKGVHRGSGKFIAAKILSSRLTRHRSFLERFHREARVAIQLDHQNIVKGFEEGEWDGFHYLVMEFVEGKSIGRVISKRGNFGEKRTLHIGRQMGEALIHANKHGLVHRDIKPDNILLMRDGVAKLADYGLVKMADDPAMVGLTVDGQIMGTPHYISPEQARGDEGIDIRSDIYSLGATLYHMLCGYTPYPGDNGAEVMSQHLYGVLEAPRSRLPEISEEANALILKMMARDAAERFQSPGEVVEAIDRYFARPQSRRSAVAEKENLDLQEESGGAVGNSTSLHELFTTPAASNLNLEGMAPEAAWPRVMGMIALFVLMMICLGILAFPRTPLASIDAVEVGAEAQLLAALALTGDARLAALKRLCRETAEADVSQMAGLFLKSFSKDDRAWREDELAAAALHARRQTAAPQVRQALLETLANRYQNTSWGKRAAATLAVQIKQRADAKKRQREVALTKQSEQRQQQIKAARLKLEREASAALGTALALRKGDRSKGLAALRTLRENKRFQSTTIVGKVNQHISAIEKEVAREKQQVRSRLAFERLHQVWSGTFVAGKVAAAKELVMTFLEENDYSPYHARAMPLLLDCNLLLDKRAFLFKGLEGKIGHKVRIKMAGGERLVGELLEVTVEGAPSFILQNSSGRRVSRFVAKLSEREKLRYASLGAGEEPWRGRVLMGLIYLQQGKKERAAKSFAVAAESKDPYARHHDQLVKTWPLSDAP